MVMRGLSREELPIYLSAKKIHNGTPKTITDKELCYFSGGIASDKSFPKKTIHTCLETAKKCGLTERVASGAMIQGYLTDLMVSLFGDKWLSDGKMQLKFIKGVTIGDTIVPCAEMKKYRNGKFYLDVWCENQNGHKVAVGHAII